MNGDQVELHHQAVARRLRDRRRGLGLTQKEVVSRLSRLGVQTTNKALSCCEHGSGLDAGKLPELARALDCTTTYLLGLTDEPHHWEPDPNPAAAPSDALEPSTGSGVRRRETRPEHRRRTWILGPGPPAEPLHARRARGSTA